MISADQALGVVLETLRPLPPEKVSLLDAVGRVLAEDVCAPRDLPPQHNSAMDGFAFLRGDPTHTSGGFRVVDDIPAGATGRRPLEAGECARIMTGAPLPEGADTVVPLEDTDGEGGAVVLRSWPERGANVRWAGEDVRKGALVIPSGAVVRPAEVGMLAALGRSFVAVHQRPRVAVLATGDEILDLDAPPDGGKIVNSNSYGVAAQIADAGGIPVILGIGKDDPEGLLEMLARAEGADAVVTTGGVSMGDRDYVKAVLARWGVEVQFWKVAIKPGKPVVFGRRGRTPVFGLPGNPVSAMVGFEEFVRPALRRLQGHSLLFRPVLDAVLGEEAGAVRTKPGRMDFVRCRVEPTEGGFLVVSVKRQSSGLLTTLVEANGLLVFPEDSTGAQPGDRVRVQLYDYGVLEGREHGLRGTTGDGR